MWEQLTSHTGGNARPAHQSWAFIRRTHQPSLKSFVWKLELFFYFLFFFPSSFFPSRWQINATGLLPFMLTRMFCTESAAVSKFLTWCFVLITFSPVLCHRHHINQSDADRCSVTGRKKPGWNICRELSLQNILYFHLVLHSEMSSNGTCLPLSHREKSGILMGGSSTPYWCRRSNTKVWWRPPSM